MSNPRRTRPRVAMNTALHEIVNLLKMFGFRSSVLLASVYLTRGPEMLKGGAALATEAPWRCPPGIHGLTVVFHLCSCVYGPTGAGGDSPPPMLAAAPPPVRCTFPVVPGPPAPEHVIRPLLCSSGPSALCPPFGDRPNGWVSLMFLCER